MPPVNKDQHQLIRNNLWWFLPMTHSPQSSHSNLCRYGVYRTVDIAGVIILVHFLVVKSLQLVWRLGTHRWNLRVPRHKMSCTDLVLRRGTRVLVPVMSTRLAWTITGITMPSTLIYWEKTNFCGSTWQHMGYVFKQKNHPGVKIKKYHVQMMMSSLGYSKSRVEIKF